MSSPRIVIENIDNLEMTHHRIDCLAAGYYEYLQGTVPTCRNQANLHTTMNGVDNMVWKNKDGDIVVQPIFPARHI